MEFDEIDKQILRILFKNGRESYSKIKNNVFKPDNEKMSHTGIRKRIRRLKNKELLKVQGNINVNALNYVGVIILIEVENYERIVELTDYYSDCPRNFLFLEISGEYNLALGFLGRNINDLHQFLNICGPTNKKGILHSAIMYINNVVYPKFIPLDMFNVENKEKTCENICCDCSKFTDDISVGCGDIN
ncbi:MAG: hypothetical protein P8Y70_15755 [Candidatus Lokiarchaeota archaeon]